MNIQPFMRCDQYNFIKIQLRKLVRTHSIGKDPVVLNAVKMSTLEAVFNIFPDLNSSEKEILNRIIEVKEDFQADAFLTELSDYVIPFRGITEKTVEKLFPKVKKLKVPKLEEMDFKTITYLSWYDIRQESKFLIAEYDGKLKGLRGTFKGKVQGICCLCNEHTDVGLFMVTVKSGIETYTNRGNYICIDSQKCNEHITDLDKINKFIDILEKN